MKTKIVIQGRLKIFEKIGDREVLLRDTENKVVNAGLNLVLDFLIGSGSPLGIEYLAVGTGTTAAAAANTTARNTYIPVAHTPARTRTPNHNCCYFASYSRTRAPGHPQSRTRAGSCARQ